MHSVEGDIPWLHWTVGETAQSGVVYAGADADRWLELIDHYQIYSETPSNWYRLERDKTWLGHTISLCGTHRLDWSSDRASGCENLTRVLQAIAASLMPCEQTGCRHEIGGCVTRLTKVATGPVCHHSLPLEVSHRFTTIDCNRQRENECLEQLEYRLVVSGVPKIRSSVDWEAA